MKVGVYIPTRGQLWHETVGSLLELVDDPHIRSDDELGVHLVKGSLGVVETRNACLRMFLDSDAEVLVMVDDDVVFQPNLMVLADRVAQGDAEIVAAVCPVGRPHLPIVPNVYSWDGERVQTLLPDPDEEISLCMVDAVGFGAVAISRKAANALKPFKLRYSKGEVVMGEDIDFCLRARARKMKVAVDFEVVCEHMLLVHGNGLAQIYNRLLIGERDD